MIPKGAESPDRQASIVRACAFGFNTPHTHRLAPIDLRRAWMEEWWAWDDDKWQAHYEAQRDAIDAAARAVGLNLPWVVTELERRRESRVSGRSSIEPP